MTDWTQIVQQHGPMVWRTVYRLLNNEADVADCFQRTFMSAFTLSQREPIGNWQALLRKLATARALECLRQRRREADRLTSSVEACVDRKALGPDRAAEAAELAEHLRCALAELDPRQAEVFCLACLDDQSYQQIAAELGITVNHVGVLLNRAKSGLRERLRARTNRLGNSANRRFAMIERNQQVPIEPLDRATEALRNVPIPDGPPPQLAALTVQAVHSGRPSSRLSFIALCLFSLYRSSTIMFSNGRSLVWRWPLALPLFAVTLFVSAFLLFLVQPMIGKMILPKLGGTPQVWNTCMLFFQVTLLVGYGYTHFVSTKLPLRRQIVIHGILLFVPFIFLLLLPGGPFNVVTWTPPAGSNPIWATLLLLAIVVGVPFFVVSTSAPLLQKWFANTGHPSANDPYFLYGASNLGSLLSLVCYPFMVEPLIPLRAQAWVWTVAFVFLAALILASASLVWKTAPRLALAGGPGLDVPPVGEIPQPVPVLTPAPASTAVKAGPAPSVARTGIARKKGMRHPGRPAPPVPSVAVPKVDVSQPTTAVVDWKRRLRWVLLAFVPSSLMLGVTSYCSVDLSPFPLLWVIPLALYLLSFILVFSKWPVPWVGVPHDIFVFLGVPAIIILFFVLLKGGFNPFSSTLLTFSGFFFVTMVCHGELAKDRPTTRYLTEYFLLMSVGGALGGVFNALIAPQVFTGVAEYPIAIAAACFLRPTLKKNGFLDELSLKMPWALFAVGLAAVAVGLGLIVPVDRLITGALVLLGVGLIVLAVMGASQDTETNFANSVRETGDNVAKSFGKPTPHSYWVLNYGLDIALALFVFLLTLWIKNNARETWGWYQSQGNGLVSIMKFLGFTDKTANEYYANALPLGLYGLGMIFCIMFGFGRALRFGLSMSLLMVAALVIGRESDKVIYAGRSYFGVLRVLEDVDRLKSVDEEGNVRFVDPDIHLKDENGKDILAATYTYLMHGTTYHGRNYHEPPALRRVLTTYYHQKGPVGVIMDRYRWFSAPEKPEPEMPTRYGKPAPHGTFYADARLPVSMIGMGALPACGIGNLPLDQLSDVWTEPPYATIGLGSGTMAGYGRWLQHMTFYEIDDNIRNFSLPPKDSTGQVNPRFLWKGKDPFFTYVTDAIGRGTNLQIVMGDARLSMAQERPEVAALYAPPKAKGEFYDKRPVPEGMFAHRDNYYKVIVVDAFSSDAIPIHLITKEAIELYMSKLAPDGVLCVHTSNRHMDLVKPVSDIAAYLGLKAIVGHDVGRSRRDAPPYLGHFGSEYVMIARDEKYLPQEGEKSLGTDNVQRWDIPIPPRMPLWTDDFSNIVSILR